MGAGPGAPPERRGWGLGTVAILVVLATVGVAVFLSSRGQDATVADLPRDGRLAVLPFVDGLGDPDMAWVEHGLPELVFEILDATESVRIVPRQRLSRLLAERGLGDGDDDREAMRRVARSAGADLVLEATASRGERGESAYALEYTIQVPGDGNGDGAIGGRLLGDDLVGLGEELALALARRLSRGRSPAPLAVTVTASPFLARLYAMGVEELWSGKPEAAIPIFELCGGYDPFFALARVRLADAEEAAGRVPRGRELRQELLRDLESRGRRELQGRTLVALGETSVRQRKWREAEGLFTQAHTLFVNGGDTARRAEAVAGLAEVAIGTTPESGRAEELLFELLELQRAMNDRLGQVETLFALGNLALRGGDLDAATDYFQEGRELAREIADPFTVFRLTERVADVAARRGDDTAAVDDWLVARQHFAARGADLRHLLLTQKIAEGQLRLGRLEAAEESFQQLLEQSRERSILSRQALASMRLAEILLRQGYPYQAREPLLRALALDEHVDDHVGLQVLIAWLAYEQGNLRLAAETQRAAKRQASPRDWDAEREAFLTVYERALATGERLPLPVAKP